MGETCTSCRKEFDSGIWLSPQFREEKVLLFCSEKCKENYLKLKLRRIKVNYPNYYEKIINSAKGKKDNKDRYLPFLGVVQKKISLEEKNGN